jgi:NAD-dependent deacetylase sirtuin 4
MSTAQRTALPSAGLPSVAPVTVLPSAELVQALARTLSSSRRLLTITGAGVSTSSGIPDYRSSQGAYTKGYKPLLAQEFASSEAIRSRYWARSYAGYGRFALARPGRAHFLLVDLERHFQRIGGTLNIVTQNVDRLHTHAGSRQLVELHGTVHDVECADCGHAFSRAHQQNRLDALNPGWLRTALAQSATRPDGDVELPPAAIDSFRMAECERCGSTWVSPSVVWFGGTLKPAVAQEARALAEACDSMLVVGSTLSTHSALRLVKAAAERDVPVTIINQGKTRGDEYAAVKVDASIEETLSSLMEALAGRAAAMHW